MVDKISKEEAKSLFDEFRNSPTVKGNSEKVSKEEAKALFDEFRGGPIATPTAKDTVAKEPTIGDAINRNIDGGSFPTRLGLSAVRGIGNVADTLAEGIAYAGERGASGLEQAGLVSPEGYKKVVDWQQGIKGNIKQERDEFNRVTKGDITSTVGEIGGEIAATLPVTPMRLFKVIEKGVGALPTINAAGQKIAAPFVNRMLGNTINMGIGGGQYGAMTASKDDKSLLRHVGEGVAFGAVGGPIFTGAGQVLGKGVELGRRLMDVTQVNKATGSLDPIAVRDVAKMLRDEGLTPAQADAALAKLGPKATLADISEVIEHSAKGLAEFGGKPTGILKGRYGAREDTASADRAKFIEQRLGGPKPDLEAEKKLITDEATRLSGPDYKASKAAGDVFDAKPIIQNIDDALVDAVGSEKKALLEAKGFFFREGKKDPATGEIVKELKTDLTALHKTRIGLDAHLDEMQQPGNSLAKSTLRAVEKVRGELDKLLKTNTKFADADAAFSERMTVKDALDYGYNAIRGAGNARSPNKEEFVKFWDAATPAQQEAIKKGIRARIGDVLENTAKGELSGAKQLFASKTANREKFIKAFGSDAEGVLDELAAELAFKSTESAVRYGSKTAGATAVRMKYSGEGNPSVVGSLPGLLIDVGVTGAPGAATLVSGAGRIAMGAVGAVKRSRLERLVEGTADIISKQGADRDQAMSVITRVDAIQQATQRVNKGAQKIYNIRLPTTLPAPLLDRTHETVRAKVGY